MPTRKTRTVKSDGKEFLGRVVVAVGEIAREGRDEGRGHRVLGEEPPQEVRQGEGHAEGVGEPARAHKGGLRHLAQEAEDAGGHREERELAAVAKHSPRRAVSQDAAGGIGRGDGRRFVGHSPGGYTVCIAW